ncbi:acetoacetate decarboxylase family protein [Capillimicrobium parvum]|uniref:Uncharacterized protein n=1 Tax=Capillimicrobium parvum TaxID=2884022 RepID=A0A9E7C1M4_9ACTN|nr:acetoacetate decarboxylase family protein [Capillimicrobium parvum]UGS37635.1 hypothetical protein DSM104329_04055 [Capillimicrobium parvum]
MSSPAASSDLAALPLGLEGRQVRERGTLPELLAGQGGTDDIVDPALFGRLEGRPVLEVGGLGDGQDPVRLPIAVTSACTLGATFSIPLEQAWALLPATERLVPVRVTPRRAAITFYGTSVRRGGLGPYHELGVALPVLLDAERVPAPLPPALWRDPALGMYCAEMPVDSERSAIVGALLAGLPRVVGDTSVDISAKGGTARLSMDGRTMATIDVELSRWPRVRRHDLSHQIYSLLEGRIVRTRSSMVGEGYRGRRGAATVSLGDHRRAQRLARLELSRRPLEVSVLRRVNRILWAPEDIGPI